MAELIVALDMDSRKKALELAERLKGTVNWLKIGLEMFTRGGPDFILELSGMGFSVFLDLKLYDIPNTVARAVSAAANLNAKMMTIHLSGGRKMCETALAAAGPDQLILGVTALTSFSDGEMPGIGVPVKEHAARLADLAADWGMGGIVCSPLEVADIRKSHPELVCVCPGIRPAGSETGDQARAAAPADAVRNGAGFLVCGRPVTRAADPRLAAKEIMRQMEGA